MPIDPTGWCCGLFVWIGGTLFVVLAARRERLARPAEVPGIAVPMAGLAAAVLLFFAALAIRITYDLLTTKKF